MVQFDVWYDLASERDYVASVQRYSRPSNMQFELPDPAGPQIDADLKPRLVGQLKNKEHEISTTLEALFGNDAPKLAIVRISSYGGGGSYHLRGDWSRQDPGVTIRKDRLFDADGFLKTAVLIHELIHVCIEPQLRNLGWSPKYDPRREWLVDEIMRSNEFRALSPGHQHQPTNLKPAKGLDELSFAKRPSY